MQVRLLESSSNSPIGSLETGTDCKRPADSVRLCRQEKQHSLADTVAVLFAMIVLRPTPEK